jgi:AcrR family transcriptional regulator
MPKIIKDADGAVRRCAAELFEKLGYRKVDIKMISAGSGVAVGTVYNYYKNKLELYLSVTEESWQKTFDRLEREAARQSGEKDRLSAISAILYEDMRDRRGLGRALVFPDGEERGEQERLRQLHVKLAGSAGRIIGDICRSGQPGAAGQNRPDDTVRLAETLLASAAVLIDCHPGEDSKNIDFLTNIAAAARGAE